MPTLKTQSDFCDPILLNEKELSIHYRANKALSQSNNENTNEQQYVAIVVMSVQKKKFSRQTTQHFSNVMYPGLVPVESTECLLCLIRGKPK